MSLGGTTEEAQSGSASPFLSSRLQERSEDFTEINKALNAASTDLEVLTSSLSEMTPHQEHAGTTASPASSMAGVNETMLAEVSSLNILFKQMERCQSEMKRCKVAEAEKFKALEQSKHELEEATGRLDNLQRHVREYEKAIADMKVELAGEKPKVIDSVTQSAEKGRGKSHNESHLVLELRSHVSEVEDCLSTKNKLLQELARAETRTEELRKALYESSDALVTGNGMNSEDGEELKQQLSRASALRKEVLEHSSNLDIAESEYMECNMQLESAKAKLESTLTNAGYGAWLISEDGSSASQQTDVDGPTSTERRDRLTRAFLSYLRRSLSAAEEDDDLSPVWINDGDSSRESEGEEMSMPESPTSISDVLSGTARIIRHKNEAMGDYLLRLERRLQALKALESNCRADVDDARLDAQLAEEEHELAMAALNELQIEEKLLERVLNQEESVSPNASAAPVPTSSDSAAPTATGVAADINAAQSETPTPTKSPIKSAADNGSDDTTLSERRDELSASNNSVHHSANLLADTRSSPKSGSLKLQKLATEVKRLDTSNIEANIKSLSRAKSAAEYWSVKIPNPGAPSRSAPARESPRRPAMKSPESSGTQRSMRSNQPNSSAQRGRSPTARRLPSKAATAGPPRAPWGSHPRPKPPTRTGKAQDGRHMAQVANRLEELAMELANQKALVRQGAVSDKIKELRPGGPMKKTQSQEKLSASRDLLFTLHTQQEELERLRKVTSFFGERGSNHRDAVKNAFSEIKKTSRSFMLDESGDSLQGGDLASLVDWDKPDTPKETPAISEESNSKVQNLNDVGLSLGTGSGAADISMAVNMTHVASPNHIIEESSSNSDDEPSAKMLARQQTAQRLREQRQGLRKDQGKKDKSVLGVFGKLLGIKSTNDARAPTSVSEDKSIMVRRTNATVTGIDLDKLHDDIGVKRVTEEEMLELKRQDAIIEQKIAREKQERELKLLEEKAIAMINAAALHASEKGHADSVSIHSDNNFGLDDMPEWAKDQSSKGNDDNVVEKPDEAPAEENKELFESDLVQKPLVGEIHEETIQSVHTRYMQQLNRQISKIDSGADVLLSQFIRPLASGNGGENSVADFSNVPEDPNDLFVRRELQWALETLAFLQKKDELLKEHEILCPFTGIALARSGTPLALLQLTVLSARALPQAQIRTPDPYVECDLILPDSAFPELVKSSGLDAATCKQEWKKLQKAAALANDSIGTQRTEVRTGNLYPEWRENLVLAPISTLHQYLLLRVKDRSSGYKADKVIAECILPLTHLVDQRAHRLVMRLRPPVDGGHSQGPKLGTDCVLRVEAKLAYSKEMLNKTKIQETSDRVGALQSIAAKLNPGSGGRATQLLRERHSTSKANHSSGRSSRYKYKYAGLDSADGAVTQTTSSRGTKVPLHVVGLRERAARPDDDFGLPGRHERSKFEKKNVSGYFGPKSGPPRPRSPARRARSQSRERGGARSELTRSTFKERSSSPLREEIMATRRGNSAPPVMRGSSANANIRVERHGFGSTSPTGRDPLNRARHVVQTGTSRQKPSSSTSIGRSSGRQRTTPLLRQVGRAVSTPLVATPDLPRNARAVPSPRSSGMKWSTPAFNQAELYPSPVSSVETPVTTAKREQQDRKDAEAEADVIIARAKAKAHVDQGDPAGILDREKFQRAIDDEMAQAEEAAKKHAAEVAYIRTFRRAYVRVPPAGQGARKAESKQTFIKGGKGKWEPVFGAASKRF